MFALYLLCFIGIVALWFLLTFAFKPFGAFLLKIFKDTKETLLDEEKEN